MRYLARAALLLAIAGAALAAPPASALDLEVMSVSVVPVVAEPGDAVTVTARVKRSDPLGPNPLGPAVVQVSFLRTGEAKPFATRQVRLAANATADVSAPWKATAGRHQFNVRVALAPNQKLPADSDARNDTRAASGEVVITAQPVQPRTTQESKDSKQSDSQQPTQTTRTQGQQQQEQVQAQSQGRSTQQGSGQSESSKGSSSGSPSTAGVPFRPIELTTSGIRLAGGPLPAPGAGPTSATAPFRPVTLTTAGMRLVGGALPARDAGTPAAAPFRPATITTAPMSVRGQ